MTTHPIRYLVLWLSTACNLRCVYCYRGEQASMTMPFAVAQTALRLAGASGLPFHVQLAGGEPTLEPWLIEVIAKSVRNAGWPATLAMQTNGTLLDAGLVAVCKRYGVDICVSIDGPPAVQERVRGNAKAAFQGLNLLSRSEMAIRVTTVLSDANVGYLGELVLCLAAFSNVEGVALDALVRKGRAETEDIAEPTAAATRVGMTGMLRTLKQVNRLRAAPIRWRECDAVSRALKENVETPAYCHACRGESLAVHPDGTVYPCSQTVGDRAKDLGTLDRIDWAKLRNMYRGVRLQGSCSECELNGRCPGDCPSRLQYNGSASPHVMCTVYRTIAGWVAEKETS
ncbi:MAG: radical SAM protein [Desulfomonilaceae bacterium]